jgi:hypothetical protein
VHGTTTGSAGTQGGSAGPPSGAALGPGAGAVGSVDEDDAPEVVLGEGATLLGVPLLFVGATSTDGATDGVLVVVVDEPPAGVRASVVSA